jgi:hypothetical protein
VPQFASLPLLDPLLNGIESVENVLRTIGSELHRQARPATIESHNLESLNPVVEQSLCGFNFLRCHDFIPQKVDSKNPDPEGFRRDFTGSSVGLLN